MLLRVDLAREFNVLLIVLEPRTLLRLELVPRICVLLRLGLGLQPGVLLWMELKLEVNMLLRVLELVLLRVELMPVLL